MFTIRPARRGGTACQEQFQNRRGLSRFCAVLGAKWDCPLLREGFETAPRAFPSTPPWVAGVERSDPQRFGGHCGRRPNPATRNLIICESIAATNGWRPESDSSTNRFASRSPQLRSSMIRWTRCFSGAMNGTVSPVSRGNMNCTPRPINTMLSCCAASSCPGVRSCGPKREANRLPLTKRDGIIFDQLIGRQAVAYLGPPDEERRTFYRAQIVPEPFPVR
jgi:hypothetical protein